MIVGFFSVLYFVLSIVCWGSDYALNNVQVFNDHIILYGKIHLDQYGENFLDPELERPCASVADKI